jgi:hypothetical protein
MVRVRGHIRRVGRKRIRVRGYIRRKKRSRRRR